MTLAYFTLLVGFGALNCLQTESQCVDTVANCALLDSLFEICRKTVNAKKVCEKFCKLCDAVDGNWALWSTWSGCDVTCGNGTRIRLRTCSNPKPSFGGQDCIGPSLESVPCRVPMLCPVHGGWQSWQEWSQCSITCGVGMQNRYRNCSNPVPDRFGDHCFGNSLEIRLCYPGLCLNIWSEWQAWSTCNNSCDDGVRLRTRKCFNPSPFTTEGYCVGNATETKACEKKNCYHDCYEIHKNLNDSQSGIYNVTLWKTKQIIQVKCDMDTDGGGWTVMQYRFNGSIDFYRNFKEYEKGFGNLESEFWIGLKNIQEMTSRGKTVLRIDLTAADDTTVSATFQDFYLGEGSAYNLYIKRGNSKLDSGSYGLSNSNGRPFSTFDIDRDNYFSRNCAVYNHGAWWYNGVGHVNLNGDYVKPGTIRHTNRRAGMIYYLFNGWTSLKVSKMMFRHV